MSDFPSQTVVSLVELIAWAAAAREQWEERHQQHRTNQPPPSPWFRGVSSASYELLPGLYRPLVVRQLRNPLEQESRIARAFYRRSIPYLDAGTGRLSDSREVYFAMQHYALPTRLLDWTQSVAVAAYFAARQWFARRVAQDAAVWMINAPLFNSIVGEIGYKVVPSTEPTLQRYFLDTDGPSQGRRSASLPEVPAAFVPVSPTQRVVAQRSVFTIHGAMRVGIDQFEHAEVYLRKALIPAQALSDMADELTMVGAREASLFPDIEGLTREILMHLGLPS